MCEEGTSKDSLNPNDKSGSCIAFQQRLWNVLLDIPLQHKVNSCDLVFWLGLSIDDKRRRRAKGELSRRVLVQTRRHMQIAPFHANSRMNHPCQVLEGAGIIEMLLWNFGVHAVVLLSQDVLEFCNHIPPVTTLSRLTLPWCLHCFLHKYPCFLPGLCPVMPLQFVFQSVPAMCFAPSFHDMCSPHMFSHHVYPVSV